MADGLEPSKQKAILTAFGDIARESKLLPATSLDQAKYLLAQIVAKAAAGVPLDVSPLDQYLRSSGATAEGVNEVVLALHRRVDNLGLQMRLPPAVAALPAEEQQRLAVALLARVSDSRKTVSSTQSMRLKAELGPPKAEEPKAAPAPTAPKRKLHPGLAIGLGAVALVAIGWFVLPLFEADPAAAARKALSAPGEGRYACAGVVVSGGSVICKVEPATLSTSLEEHRAKLAKTREVAKTAGYKGLRLVENGTGRPVPE